MEERGSKTMGSGGNKLNKGLLWNFRVQYAKTLAKVLLPFCSNCV